MTSKEIRHKFLDFFAGYDHKVVPSSSLIPVDDPTLLFTNAGMNQFKEVFLGKEKREYIRAASSQKCMRAGGKHNDLEIVGQTTRHQTFFEMLGNFSFGDYFKEEAIAYAWEFVTKTLGIPKDRLYATVYEEDEEAFEIWKKIDPALSDRVGSAFGGKGRILRFGEKDNFWSMGDVGPCGPCSEIHYDQGEEYSCGPNCRGVECDCDRFSELWNLVFMQFNRDESGKMKPLPKPSVDTGAGLERFCAVMQGIHSNYDTDLLKPLVQKVVEISGKEYSPGPEGMPHRVVADHVRALSFCIADGGMPSNEGRGYVLRRILRRASYNGRLLDIHRPFMSELLDTLENIMADVYPALKEKRKTIESFLHAEEESFERTLDTGLELFEQVAKKVEKSGQNVIAGEDAFKLYDTYGFPLDLTQIMATKRGMTVDVVRFEEELEKQRQRSKEAARISVTEAITSDAFITKGTVFTGYQKDFTESVVVSADETSIVLEATPFYAESGGQIGDKGMIKGEDFEFEVTDTKKINGRIIHVGKIKKGKPKSIVGKKMRVEVDIYRRNSIKRNHTATHLLHRALKKVLGEHVNQSGSLVAPDRLRFDFTHFKAVTSEELLAIEKEVNRKILENLPVRPEPEVPFEEAKRKGAVSLFGEKYTDKVRVVRIEAKDSTPENPKYYSQELCGGTHVDATGEIGQFRIVSESAIAAGIRRIEAVTGLGAFELMDKERGLLNNLSKTFKAPAEEVESRVGKLLEEKKLLERKLGKFKVGSYRAEAKELVDKAPFVEGTNSKVIAVKVEKENREELLSLADVVREALTSGVATLASEINGSLALVTVVTDDLIKSGIKAGEIVKEAAKAGGGSGGGKPHLAQAGVKDTTKIEQVLEAAQKKGRSGCLNPTSPSK